MKAFRSIATIITGVIMIPLVLVALLMGMYGLDMSLATEAAPGIFEPLRLWASTALGFTSIPLWLVILAPLLAVTFISLFIASSWKGKSLHTNIYLTILKWLSVVVIIGAPLASLVIGMIAKASTNEFASAFWSLSFDISSVNISVMFIFLILYILLRVFGRKISLELNRTLTAARTAKEMNKPGRTPDILLNFYKIFNFIFPELMLIGILLSLFIGTQIAVYLWSILIGLGVFLLISTWADGNVRREAKQLSMKDKVGQTKAIEKVLKGDEQ